MIKITLEDAKKIYGNEKDKKELTQKEFNRLIPAECRTCGLLEKDIYRKTIKCIYRTKSGCMLGEYYGKRMGKRFL